MNKKLKAEIWEIQIILYWILSALLFQFKHPILGWVALAWSIISLNGIFRLLTEIYIENKRAKESD